MHGRAAIRVGIAAVAALLMLPAVARADTVTVNTTADHNDKFCDAADCTLREAVELGTNTINLPKGNFKLDPELGELVLVNDHIVGAGARLSIIDGGGATRVLRAGDGTSSIEGVSNIEVQDIWPGRPVNHIGALHDAVTYALVLDAIDLPGPADWTRISAAVCQTLLAPGLDPTDAVYLQTVGLGQAGLNTVVTGPKSSAEPPLKPYVLAAASWLELASFKGSKTEQAAEVGKRLAASAKKAGIETVVFDRGGYLYHGRVKALADGAREGGLEF